MFQASKTFAASIFAMAFLEVAQPPRLKLRRTHSLRWTIREMF